MSAVDQEEQEKRAAYVKEKQLHHLFELLATKTLQNRPENVFEFLRNQLNSIEEGEKNAHKYDPSELLYNDKHHQPAHHLHGPAGEHHEKADGGSPSGQLKVNLAIFGLNNAGKTALVSAMGGNVDPNTTPTVGYSPMHFETDDFMLCIFDLGGAKNFRGIWPHYYHDCHGFIYVIDSADTERFDEAQTAFDEFSQHEYVKGKPILVFSNKRDLEGARSQSFIGGELLGLSKLESMTKIIQSCAVVEGQTEEVDEGVEWILDTIKTNYGTLSTLVTDQTAMVKAEKKKRLEEQRRRVEEQKAAEAAEKEKQQQQ